MSQRLRLAFAGTPEFAAVSLRALVLEGQHEIVAVYTQPDRPAGRGRVLTPSPVKRVALEHGLPVRQPLSLRDEHSIDELRGFELDLLVVVAYGLILPARLLGIPRLGSVNVHASLLPRWRGAAPIERAILAGDTTTGITLMQIEPALDSGPMLRQASCEIRDNDTAGSLSERLARLGAEVLVSTLPQLARGEITPERQDESRVTYAAKIENSEAALDWSRPATELARMIRAFNPRPGASAILNGETVKIWEAVPLQSDCRKQAGEIERASADGIDIATGSGLLRLLTLQVPGRASVSARQFLNARPQLKTHP